MTLPYGKVWNDDAGQLDSSVFGISAMTGGRAGSKPAPTVKSGMTKVNYWILFIILEYLVFRDFVTQNDKWREGSYISKS